MATTLTQPSLIRSKMFSNLETQTMTKEWLNFLMAICNIIGELYQDGILKLPAHTPDQITAHQNNYNPGSCIISRISSDASWNITGIVPGGNSNGRIWIPINVGTKDIVLKHQNLISDAANRIISNTGADITLSANEIAVIWYDVTTARWRATEL